MLLRDLCAGSLTAGCARASPLLAPPVRGGGARRASVSVRVAPRAAAAAARRRRARHVVCSGGGGTDSQAVLERYFRQLCDGEEDVRGRLSGMAPDAVATLAEEAGLSAEQVQRWLARRLLSLAVAPPPLLPDAPRWRGLPRRPVGEPAAALAEEAEAAEGAAGAAAAEEEEEEEEPEMVLETGVEVEDLSLDDNGLGYAERGVTAEAKKFIEANLKKRKAEWKVMNGKPVAGFTMSEDGIWLGADDDTRGWAALPDSVAALPTMADGSMMVLDVLQNRRPEDPAYIPVDLVGGSSGSANVGRPEQESPEAPVWEDMDNVEPGDDIPWFPDWRLLGRHALAHLRVGQELDGMVVEQNLYWGAVVDVNAEYHGLVYIAEVDWYPLRDIVDLGVPVRCRVSRINDPERFRFPLELELVDPDISDALTQGPPERRPLLFYADETPEQWAAAAARAGRGLPPPPPPEEPFDAARSR